MSDIKKLCIKITILCAVTVVLSVVIFLLVYLFFPNVYNDNYQKAFVYQYRNLTESDPAKNKIIVFGASDMLFAVNAQTMEEYTGIPVYQLGVHGGMGMCYTIELVRENINPGDIVIFPFAEFKDNDYGMQLIYVTLEGEDDMFFSFTKKHLFEVIRSAGNAALTKLRNEILKINPVDPVYSINAFNNRGNIILPREKCIVREYVLKENSVVYDINSVDPSCFKILNDLSMYCSDVGADFYVTFSPIWSGAVASTPEELKLYKNELDKNIDAAIISDIDICLVPQDYLYNDLRHLNDTGAEYYTKKLYDDLIAVQALK